MKCSKPRAIPLEVDVEIVAGKSEEPTPYGWIMHIAALPAKMDVPVEGCHTFVTQPLLDCGQVFCDILLHIELTMIVSGQSATSRKNEFRPLRRDGVMVKTQQKRAVVANRLNRLPGLSAFGETQSLHQT